MPRMDNNWRIATELNFPIETLSRRRGLCFGALPSRSLARLYYGTPDSAMWYFSFKPFNTLLDMEGEACFNTELYVWGVPAFWHPAPGLT